MGWVEYHATILTVKTIHLSKHPVFSSEEKGFWGLFSENNLVNSYTRVGYFLPRGSGITRPFWSWSHFFWGSVDTGRARGQLAGGWWLRA